MNPIRFQKQLDFLTEVDKVKNIIRKTKLFDKSRFENDAEHSWTICLMAILFKEYSNAAVNIERVIRMLLIHDIVEIDAGDTFLYSQERKTSSAREEAAAKRIFSMLERDQAEEFYDLWVEFEERKTDDAKYASVFDRLEPILQNYANEGYTWKKHGITKSMVMEKNRHIEEASAEIWKYAASLLDKCVEQGYLGQ